MDFNATIDLIIKDLDEASEIIDDLKKYSGVPLLQVELAKAKCKSAADVISLLKDLNNKTTENEPVNSIIEIESEVIITQEETKNEKEGTPEEIIAKVPEADTPSSLPEKNRESLRQRGKETTSPIYADRFSNLSNSFNEQMLTKKTEDELNGMLKTKPLTDLSDAIGINDRFLFIREIFDGDKEAYNQAITRLNKSESIKDAMAVIMSYTGDSDENKAVVQLLDLVKRKLPHNE